MATPTENANLFAALRAAFPKDLNTCAVETDSGLQYSWRDLDEATAMVANLLEFLELPKGARIAVQVEKSVEALVLYLATLRAGLVYLPLNTAYQSAEMAYFIEDAKPSVVVCSGRNFGWISKMAFLAGTAHVFTLNDDRTGSLLDRAAQFPRAHTIAQRQPGDLAAIIYTSGTTGRSKGAVLSHGNLLSNARVLQAYWDWKPGDVLIHALPIFHVHGLFVAIHGALINGSKMVWCAKFDPKVVLQHFPRATVFMGVPTLYVRLLAEAGLTAQATKHMRLFVSGSAPMLVDTHHQWQARTGHTILERYGMSETVMLTSNPGRAADGERKVGTVGRPLPGVQLRVRDEAGKDLPQGETGGIEVRGPNVFLGYWQMPEKTAQEFTADGFFKTGDVGRVDAQGYVTIVGRSKDLIISGGYNVYPAEIEDYINNLPGVAESAVVGVPDADFGEVGVAVIVPLAGATVDPQQVIATLKSMLANFKVPKRCVVVAELPRNAMGKVQKNLLREQYRVP
ncbi:MAG: malonyl-CoA synthase [Curvibacter sp. RIFCSPHIGHO2_12_FULL_63_18]|uniref:malonate--CoA ligase n=1 Tax=Rhodoferax sp. TaxID=50421 RepID=UPI0008C84FC4|nr:malonyl-CoA synthase [Rhodoferax sp.]OGO96570.1 MAG: malonyl-CoA synthase [Curvibacter sp. GWA2_63_95]OGP00294.1 MAG: malonyl-CoA synthase [Curvibacter sp. RIFCSPHIGHO2_12_FULL_63_18]HCX82769.1 malonyl-CoA synthase [Rhodoferax sp.]